MSYNLKDLFAETTKYKNYRMGLPLWYIKLFNKCFLWMLGGTEEDSSLKELADIISQTNELMKVEPFYDFTGR